MSGFGEDNGMESPKDDEKTETERSDSPENTTQVKIRDLRPEKDPMGAGSKGAPQTFVQNRWPSAD